MGFSSRVLSPPLIRDPTTVRWAGSGGRGEGVAVEAWTYNYVHFDEYVESGAAEREFSAFAGRLHAGEQPPDFTATRLDDGAAVRLSDWWRDRTVVVEFGSFT
jgi:hypothetical protein